MADSLCPKNITTDYDTACLLVPQMSGFPELFRALPVDLRKSYAFPAAHFNDYGCAVAHGEYR